MSKKQKDFSHITLPISMGLLAETEKKLDREIEKLNDRIQRLINKVDEPYQQVLGYIVAVGQKDKEKLDRLSEAIRRVAVINEARNKLSIQKQMLELAQNQPTEFIDLFGDFSSEVDPFLDEIFGEAKELNG